MRWPWQKQPALTAERIEPTISNETAVSNIDSWSEFLNLVDSPAGVRVNADTAMRHSAVYGCIRILATVVGMLPLPVYKVNDGGSYEKARTHPLYRTLNVSPKPGLTKNVFWEWIICNKFLSGMGYARIQRDRNGNILALRPLLAARTEPKWFDEDTNIFVHTDRLGNQYTYHQDDILQFPCVGYDGVKGLDPITHAGRNSIGTGLAQDEFAATFFKNGATPSLGVKYPDGKKLTPDQAKVIQEYVTNRTTGDNRHKPLILAEGGEHFEMTMSPEATQLLESRSFSVGDIARLFGVPLWLLQQTEKNTSWGSGIEQMSIGAVIYTFSPLLSKLEAEINLKLFANDPDHFVEFDVDGLQRGDFKARMEGIAKALGGNQVPGVMAVDEARGKLNLPRLGDGYDKPYRPDPAAASAGSSGGDDDETPEDDNDET